MANLDVTVYCLGSAEKYGSSKHVVKLKTKRLYETSLNDFIKKDCENNNKELPTAVNISYVDYPEMHDNYLLMNSYHINIAKENYAENKENFKELNLETLDIHNLTPSDLINIQKGYARNETTEYNIEDVYNSGDIKDKEEEIVEE